MDARPGRVQCHQRTTNQPRGAPRGEFGGGNFDGHRQGRDTETQKQTARGNFSRLEARSLGGFTPSVPFSHEYVYLKKEFFGTHDHVYQTKMRNAGSCVISSLF